jgi:ATP-dependent DNA ligase
MMDGRQSSSLGMRLPSALQCLQCWGRPLRARHPKIEIPGAQSYLSSMPRRPFEPCIPTRATKVPAGPDWIHEIKHDGYRLIVQREGKRVRLFTRNGHDWTDRYPVIASPRYATALLHS